MNRRRGASLIELMVVIVLASSVMLLTATLLHRLFRAENLATRSAVTDANIGRLARQFRNDVHQATSVKRLDDADKKPGLELKVDSNQTISYTAGDHRVDREVIGPEGVASRETYRLPDCRISFPIQETNLLMLQIDRPHTTLTPSQQVTRKSRGIAIEAEPGRYERLASNSSVVAKPQEESK